MGGNKHVAYEIIPYRWYFEAFPQICQAISVKFTHLRCVCKSIDNVSQYLS